LVKDIFVIDNGDTEESKLISKQYHFCLAAVMQSYKKQFSDSQGPDDTSFDEGHICVTMVFKCHGIYMAATNERTEAMCHDRYRERIKDLLARIFHGEVFAS
jgi:hypothetical protein